MAMTDFTVFEEKQSARTFLCFWGSELEQLLSVFPCQTGEPLEHQNRLNHWVDSIDMSNWAGWFKLQMRDIYFLISIAAPDLCAPNATDFIMS